MSEHLKTASCGCLYAGAVQFCSLHANAKDLWEAAMEAWSPCQQDDGGRPYCVRHFQDMPCPFEELKAVIDKAEGKK